MEQINTLDYSGIRTGYRLLVNGKTELSKEIQKSMQEYAKKIGLPQEIINLFTYSHAGTFVRIENQLYVFESVANGFKPRLFDEHYDLEVDDIMIIAPVRPFTIIEEHKILTYALHLVEVSNFYQYWGLVFWKIYIKTGIDLFGKGNKFSTMCYESTYRLMNHLYKDRYILNPEKATCYDVADLEYSKVIYRNEIAI